jgi:hypothetical protein
MDSSDSSSGLRALARRLAPAVAVAETERGPQEVSDEALESGAIAGWDDDSGVHIDPLGYGAQRWVAGPGSGRLAGGDRSDILILWDHFVHKLWGSKAGLTLTDAARQKLLDHDWPGNVREL